MSVEIGHFALILSFMIALLQASLPLFGAWRGQSALIQIAPLAALAQFACLLLAYAALTQGFVTSDFSLRVVLANSHSLKPMLYKITGVWGNHEGSMLLWVLILALYGALVALFGKSLPLDFKARVLAVQGILGVAFLAFLIFTSNPFERVIPPPLDGTDLNPLLQDPGLAFHPPFLYLGYVGLSMTFSFAVAALIQGRIDAIWARWMRPWALLAWLCLTIGIALGSWWAYYELGWGGWWFWDPVENASLMPWLISIALLHSAIVVEKRDTLKSWTILLAILAFAFSLIGTFIVRSGVITSVHAFANDPQRGLFILAITVILVGGALTLYAVRAQYLRAGGAYQVISRESGLVINNLLLIAATVVVFVGTIWPLLAEFTSGRKLSVGAPFFNMAFTPLMVVLALILPIAAIWPWKRARLRRSIYQMRGALALALAVVLLIWALQTGRSILAPVGLGLATWLLAGCVVDLAIRTQYDLRRLTRIAMADWGKTLGHAGLGFMIFGISAITAWQLEDIRLAKVGDRFSLGGYEFSFDRLHDITGPNYQALEGQFSVYRNARQVAILTPQKRFYPIAGMGTTEAGIQSGITRDLYIALGERDGESIAVRSYIKPFANWIWFGAIVMALGGLCSMFDRRLRRSAGRRKA